MIIKYIPDSLWYTFHYLLQYPPVSCSTFAFSVVTISHQFKFLFLSFLYKNFNSRLGEPIELVVEKQSLNNMFKGNQIIIRQCCGEGTPQIIGLGQSSIEHTQLNVCMGCVLGSPSTGTGTHGTVQIT